MVSIGVCDDRVCANKISDAQCVGQVPEHTSGYRMSRSGIFFFFAEEHVITREIKTNLHPLVSLSYHSRREHGRRFPRFTYRYTKKLLLSVSVENIAHRSPSTRYNARSFSIYDTSENCGNLSQILR